MIGSMTGSRKLGVLASMAVLAAMVGAGAGTAFAQEPPPVTPPPPPPVGGSLGVFGERGQFVVRSDLNLSLTHTSYSMGGGSGTVFNITPSLDYFISSNFSVGGLLGFSYATGSGNYSRTDLAIGARAGYNVVLTNVLTLWATGGLVFAHVSEDLGMGSSSGNGLQLQIFAPVLWHPASHFFIGVGPMFRADLTATTEGNDIPKETTFGLASTIGGYWGGL